MHVRARVCVCVCVFVRECRCWTPTSSLPHTPFPENTGGTFQVLKGSADGNLFRLLTRWQTDPDIDVIWVIFMLNIKLSNNKYAVCMSLFKGFWILLVFWIECAIFGGTASICLFTPSEVKAVLCLLKQKGMLAIFWHLLWTSNKPNEDRSELMAVSLSELAH